METYKPHDHGESSDKIFFKCIKQPHWSGNPKKFDTIPTNMIIGSVTWSKQKHGVTILENNRHFVNFEPNCFEEISEEQYLIETGRPIHYTEKLDWEKVYKLLKYKR